jgi:beta-alanine degradation protein BauB
MSFKKRRSRMPGLVALLASLAVVAPAYAQDPIQTDGDKYKVVFENERVRVLEYRDLPGEKTAQHHHPAFLLYALSPFQRTITLPDGKVMARAFKSGDILWSDEQTHVGTNVGQTPTHVIMVELKEDPPKQ